MIYLILLWLCTSSLALILVTRLACGWPGIYSCVSELLCHGGCVVCLSAPMDATAIKEWRLCKDFLWLNCSLQRRSMFIALRAAHFGS